MLIAGKWHSRVKSHNSRVSIETLDFARVHTFYQRDRSRITGGGAKGGSPMPGPHRRLRTIDIAGGGVPRRKTARESVTGSVTVIGAQTTG